jgi:hypothetical protein
MDPRLYPQWESDKILELQRQGLTFREIAVAIGTGRKHKDIERHCRRRIKKTRNNKFNPGNHRAKKIAEIEYDYGKLLRQECRRSSSALLYALKQEHEEKCGELTIETVAPRILHSRVDVSYGNSVAADYAEM